MQYHLIKTILFSSSDVESVSITSGSNVLEGMISLHGSEIEMMNKWWGSQQPHKA